MTLEPGLAATVACLLEATARKPGNVHRFLDFDNVGYLDFALSAAAIAEPMAKAQTRPLGETILDAVRSTRRLVATNTNLGIILLIAPLAGIETRDELSHRIASTTVEDARLAYQAIGIAHPGGMGKVPDHDLDSVPSVSLLEAMRLAADRDSVARQYTCNFADVYELALPALAQAIIDRQPLETAIITTHLAVLSQLPDTLIRRKRGEAVAREASARASDVLGSGWPDSVETVRKFDAWLRDDGHARNPGATADLVTAALFLALRVGTIDTMKARHSLGWLSQGL